MYLPYSRFNSKLIEIERSYGVDFTSVRERLKYVLDNSLFKVVELENNKKYSIDKNDYGLIINLAYHAYTNLYVYSMWFTVKGKETYYHNRLKGFFDEPSYLIIFKKCNNLVASAL